MKSKNIKIKMLKDYKLRNQILKKNSVILLKNYEAQDLIDNSIAEETEEKIDSVIYVAKQETIDKTEIKEIKEIVKDYLIRQDRKQATETIVEYIKKKYYIYTTMNDNKSEVWIYEEGIYIPNGKSHIKKICRLILDEAYTTHLNSIVTEKISADTFIKEDIFFENRHVSKLCVLNGVLNVKTKELNKWDPNKIFFNKINIEYKPGAKCDKIIEFFNDVLKFKEDLPIIQEMFGWCLYKDYFIEKAFMLIGDGRNGKGKTLELIRRFINQQNCSNIPLQRFATDPYAMCSLINKMANVGGDISRESLKDTSIIKTLTGRDSVTAQRKYLNSIEFVNYAKMLFSCNELPRVYDNSQGFWKRWIILEFPYTFESKEVYESLDDPMIKLMDTEKVDKITTPDQMSGLLNWALEGLERLFKNGDFSESKNNIDVKVLWTRKADSFQAFIMDNVEEDSNSYTLKQELKRKYVQYCKTNKLKVSSDKSIKVNLEQIGAYDTRKQIAGEQIRVWEGIKLKEKEVNKSSQGSQDSQGFLPLGEISNFAIGGKNPSNPNYPDYINKKEIKQKIIKIYDDLAKNDSTELGFHIEDILFYFSKVTKKYVVEVMEMLKKEGLFFEPQVGYFKKT